MLLSINLIYIQRSIRLQLFTFFIRIYFSFKYIYWFILFSYILIEKRVMTETKF